MIPDSPSPLTVRAVLDALPERERRFLEREIQLMAQTHPGDPPVGVMQSTGNLYWIHRATPANAGIPRLWTFMILCDGFSPVHMPQFRVLPMQPDGAQIQREAAEAGLDLSSRAYPYPKLGTVYLNVSDFSPSSLHLSGEHTTAASLAWKCNHWAYYFEAGLKDPQVWNDYCSPR